MEYPFSITASMPKWPVKRNREGTADINFDVGAGLELLNGELQVDAGQSLVFRVGGKLDVNPAIVKPFSSTAVFAAGEFDSTYFRIPVLLELHSGSLLAAGDVRYDAYDDYHHTSIGVAVSDDGGLTWHRRSILNPPDNSPTSRFLDACVVQDGTGVVYFEGANHVDTVDGDYDFLYFTSTDDGSTWTGPTSLKYLKKPSENYFFQCPGIGIVMQNGTIVIPTQAWFGGPPQNFLSTIIYSSDGGTTWTRAAADGTASTLPSFSTTECQVAEFPSPGTLMLVCRRELTTPSDIAQRTRVVVYTTNMGSVWLPHPTNLTLRQRNACMASILKISTPAGNPVLLYCAPIADSTDSLQGRSWMTLQFLPAETGSEWIPIGTILQQPSFGYSCLCFSGRYNRLLVLTEEFLPDRVASSLILRDISRFFGALTFTPYTNVNLGFAVRVISTNCSLPGSSDYLRYRIIGPEIWLAGALMPPTSGTNKFPDVLSTMFTIEAPQAFSVRGWITVFGTTYDRAYSVTPFLFEYTYTSDKLVQFKCFNAPSTGPKLSEMQRLYIPSIRIAITG
ncbi:sialidase [Raptor adenovirus 1]|uniref:Sialidase n=1 Tax=Raptor adenovirus 1 TaxID=1520002 RepID=F4MI00_9ADEN|nr:sialidase [Raptor adenovirus 1]AEC32095.1 sialidase [Raptor adenovirus 1]